MFAKLYETEVGQILVKIDDRDDHPEVRFYFQPEGLGICSIALEFKDRKPDVAWEKADKAFEEINETKAVNMVNSVLGKF